MMKRFGICSDFKSATMKWNADCDLVIQGNKKAQQEF